MLLLELDAHPKASQGQLKSWYQQYHKAEEFTQWSVEATVSDSDALQRNGTWLIKHHLEKKGALLPEQWHEVAQALATLENWEVILHLCQSFAFCPALLPESVSLIRHFLIENTTHKKPFVRAWAVTGLHELAKDFPELRVDAMRLVETAVHDPAKSVRARIRNLK